MVRHIPTLHISLLLFGAGLVVFMALDLATVIFAGLVSGIVFALYAFIIANATLSPTSPFQSPATQALRRLLVLRSRSSSPGQATLDLRNPAAGAAWRSIRDKLASWIPMGTLRGARDRLASWISMRTPRSARDEENAPAAASEHSLQDLAPHQELSRAPVSQTVGAPGVQRSHPTVNGATAADVAAHGGCDVTVSQVPVAPPVGQGQARQPIDARIVGLAPALPHWNAIPAANPDRMLQSLVWLRAASPHPWVERYIITALGDRTFVSGAGQHIPGPPGDGSSLIVPGEQILGYEVARCLSDGYLQTTGFPRKEILLREAFRATLPKTIDWSRTDFPAVLRYIRLRNNRSDADMAEPDKIQLDALLRDALLEDRIPSEQYIYVVCLAANRQGVTIDLNKVKKHCEHTDLALTTASFLMTLLAPSEPSFDELLVMAKCFGWHQPHRRPADALMFPAVLRERLGGASAPNKSAGDVELLSDIICHHVATAYSEALDILVDLLALEPPSKKSHCLFDLLDREQSPAASQAIWTICRESPVHALQLLQALPLEELVFPDDRIWVDWLYINRIAMALALSWLVPPGQQVPTLELQRKLCTTIMRQITNQFVNITDMGTIISYSPFTHPLTPVDCDWEFLTAIAARLARRFEELLDVMNKDGLRDATSVVKLFNAAGPDVGGRETGDSKKSCNLARLLGDLSRRVAFSKEIGCFIGALDELRQACEKLELKDIMGAYPSKQDLIEQWTTINPDELVIDHSFGSGILNYRDILRATFRGVGVAVKRRMGQKTSVVDYKITAEYSHLRTLDHENIIMLMGASVDEPFGSYLQTHLIFPWAEHGTVMEYIKGFPRADRLQLISNVAHGLAYIHSRTPQIVHMHVNPSDILVNSMGRAMIGGFHVSITLPQDRYTARMWWNCFTCSGPSPFGRPPYQAPEAQERNGLCSSAVDVFGWAMTAVEILSGVKPLGRLSRMSYETKDLDGNEGARPLWKVHSKNLESEDKELLGHCWPLLEHCWVDDPNGRWSMAVVVQELTDIKAARAQETAA